MCDKFAPSIDSQDHSQVSFLWFPVILNGKHTFNVCNCRNCGQADQGKCALTLSVNCNIPPFRGSLSSSPLNAAIHTPYPPYLAIVSANCCSYTIDNHPCSCNNLPNNKKTQCLSFIFNDNAIDDLLAVFRLTPFLLYFPNSEYIRRSRFHTAGRLSVPHFRINSLVFTPEPNYANALCGQKGQGCCEFLKEKTPPLGFAYSWVLAMHVDPKERRIPEERLGHLDFYLPHLGQTEEIPSEFCL